MNFLYFHWLVPIVLLTIVLIFSFGYYHKIQLNLIKKYWFKRPGFGFRVSQVCYYVGISFLLLSLLDLRGPEQKIDQQAFQEKTIILIDTSASMLAEDDVPSRLKKSVLMAKHFARRAPDHQLSLVVFAETTKKITPFTNDRDLMDARLETIKELKNQNGASNITLAIQECIQYFKDDGSQVRGNIVIFTDGEEHGEGVDLNLPQDVLVAVVGVGSKEGARIPLDDRNGFRFGFKKNKGKDVITKLDPEYFKSLENNPQVKTWIPGTYQFPSEEIVRFFSQKRGDALLTKKAVMRPVYMHYLVVPGLALLLLSYLLKFSPQFVWINLVILLLTQDMSWAQNKKKTLSPELIEKLGSLKKGKLNRSQRLNLAQKLQTQGFPKEAETIYEEEDIQNKGDFTEKFNLSTAKLQNEKYSEALDLLKDLQESASPEMKELIRQNIKKALFQQMNQEQKKKDQKKSDKSKSKNKDSQSSSGSGEGQEQDDENDENQDNDENDENQSNEQEDKKDEKESENKDESQNKKDQNKDNESEKEETNKLPPKKIDPLLKQLMSDDNQLQKKLIEKNTKDLKKRKNREIKDW